MLACVRLPSPLNFCLRGGGAAVQWYLEISKGQGTGENWFAVTTFRKYIFITTEVKKIVRCTEDFVI